MICAKISKAGFFTTVQDLGRYGHRCDGVPVSGAMDRWSYITANLLVGNDSGSACLESTFGGPEIKFLEKCLVAVTGADNKVKLSGKDVPMWETIFCRQGDILSLGLARNGCRNYIAFSGGIDAPEVLGSRSTFTAGKFGGMEGRPLKNGDILKTMSHDFSKEGVRYKYPERYRPVFEKCINVRLLRGINADLFSGEEYGKLFHKPFTVSKRFNRMGCYLESDISISSTAAADSASVPAVPGSVQILPAGTPVILLNDSQSTGGYPQIGTVISGDLWKIGQAVPGNGVILQKIIKRWRICQIMML